MKDKLTKIKVFLATTNDLHEESIEMADLIENLNYILQKKEIHIYLTKWDYLDAESSSSRKNTQYDKTLDECDICIIAFGKEFGSYKEEELKKAFEKVCIRDINPKKLYVYFKNVDKISDDLRSFRESFPEQYYKHFTGKFSDSNSLKFSFLIEFHRFQNEFIQNRIPIEIREGKLEILDQEIFIDYEKINFFRNNKDYITLNKNILNAQDRLANKKLYRNDKSDEPLNLEELKVIKNKIVKNIWESALVSSQLKQTKYSDKLDLAIKLFEDGDIEGAAEILNTTKIIKEVKNSKLNRLSIKFKDLVNNSLYELEFKLKLLKNKGGKEIKEEIISINKFLLKYGQIIFKKESERYQELLYSIMDSYEGINDKRSSLEIALNLIKIKSKTNTAKESLSFLYNEVGLLYSEIGEFNKAIYYLKKSLRNDLLIKGNKSKEVAIVYKTLGSVYSEKGEYERALEYYLKSLDITSSIYGEDHLSLASDYNNIGTTYLKLFMKEDTALNYLFKALKIYEKHGYFEDLDGYIATVSNISSVYSKKYKYPEAFNYEIKAITLKLLKYGKAHPEIAHSYNGLSVFLRKLSFKYLDLQYKHKAIEILEEYYDEDNVELALIYYNLGYSYMELGNYIYAVDYMRKALRIYRNHYGDTHPETVTSYRVLSELYKKAGWYDEFINNEKQLILIYKEIYNEKHENLIKRYDLLGSVYIIKKMFKEALECYTKAFEISLPIHYNFYDTIRYLNQIGNIYILLGENETAQLKFNEALKLLSEDVPNRVDTNEILNKLSNLYDDFNSLTLSK